MCLIKEEYWHFVYHWCQMNWSDNEAGCAQRHTISVTLCGSSLSISSLAGLKINTFVEDTKGQAILLQAWTGPQGSRRLRLQRQSAHEGGKVVSPTHRPPLPPRKESCYSFLLGAESTPGPQYDRKDYVNEKFQWHHRESNQRPSDF